MPCYHGRRAVRSRSVNDGGGFSGFRDREWMKHPWMIFWKATVCGEEELRRREKEVQCVDCALNTLNTGDLAADQWRREMVRIVMWQGDENEVREGSRNYGL